VRAKSLLRSVEPALVQIADRDAREEKTFDLAIDLGTANTLVYARGEGIVLNEPSVIALNSRTGDVLAMGHEAWQMIGRTPSYIVAVRPLRKGAITDFEITQRMIRLLLQRVGVNRFNRPRVVICVPSAITEVERRAVTDAARRAGAADAQLIEQPMAAAIGADLPILHILLDHAHIAASQVYFSNHGNVSENFSGPIRTTVKAQQIPDLWRVCAVVGKRDQSMT
jgi:hypothetical protein